MGAPKKIDVFRGFLDSNPDERAQEDHDSRGRLERYKDMKPGPTREAAMAAGNEWREDIGLDPIT